jgi:hypothetical protein
LFNRRFCVQRSTSPSILPPFPDILFAIPIAVWLFKLSVLKNTVLTIERLYSPCKIEGVSECGVKCLFSWALTPAAVDFSLHDIGFEIAHLQVPYESFLSLSLWIGSFILLSALMTTVKSALELHNSIQFRSVRNSQNTAIKKCQTVQIGLKKRIRSYKSISRNCYGMFHHKRYESQAKTMCQKGCSAYDWDR